MIALQTLKERRDKLMAELETGKAEYEALDRAMCALAGAIGELAELIDLASEQIRDEKDIQESRLGEAHQTIDVLSETKNEERRTMNPEEDSSDSSSFIAHPSSFPGGAWNDSIWRAKRDHFDREEPADDIPANS